MVRCSRCLYDASIPAITFDTAGVCNYCHTHDQLDREYPVGAAGDRHLAELANRIRREGRGKPYDVIVGVSGGCDSSYMLHLAKNVLGLRPLAVHFDNTWNSRTAVENIQHVLTALDVDLFTYVVDNEEYDDLYLSFLKAGVPEFDIQTDIGLAAVLNMAATKYGIPYVFEGHSFRTEGISPLGWVYMDGKYIESVQRRYGRLPLKTFPNMSLLSFVRSMSKIKKIRPLYYVDYRKSAAMELLTREFGWKWYGGHHLENQAAAFAHTYYQALRYGRDTRVLGYAALVRSGQLSREEGLRLLAEPRESDRALVDMVKKRLGLSEAELEAYMAQPKRTYRDFATYKRTFERLRWFFFLMYKLERVPKSFYMKYTAPDPLLAPQQEGSSAVPTSDPAGVAQARKSATAAVPVEPASREHV